MHNAYIPHLLQPLHTVVPSLSLRPQAHEKVTFCSHKFCLSSVFSIHHTVSQTCWISPKKFSRKTHSPDALMVPPALFCAMFPPTFSAALSQQLSHAAQPLSLVLHPRSSHLALMGLWLGPFSRDTARSLLVTRMPCTRHLAVCTDQPVPFTLCHKQDIPQVTIKNHEV